MAGGGGGSGGGGGTGARRVEGEGGKAKLGRCGGRREVGMTGAWEARVLGRIGVSRGEQGEIILEPMAWDEEWRRERSSKTGWSQGRRF